MKYLLIVFGFATGCSELQTKLDMQRDEQLTCRAENESLCAGWKL